MRRLIRMIAILLGALTFGVAVLVAIGWSSFGTRPSARDQARFERSSQYVKLKRTFDNRIPELRKRMMERISIGDYFRFVFGGSKQKSPDRPLPIVAFDRENFLKPSASVKAVWLGHSTVLVNVSGKVLLFDPVFSGHASPLFFGVPRFQAPAVALRDLPPVDFYVLSHDHYDHLDRETAEFFRDKTTQFVVSLGVGGHLKGWGIAPERITELDWWQSHSVGGLEFTATPAQHFSGRTPFHVNETLWASWVVSDGESKIYFSGDSGYDTHFKAIGQKLGPFDVAFVENGQYNEKWPEVHLLPPQTIQAFKDLRAKSLFPIHWGMFVLSQHPWFEPAAETYRASREQGLRLFIPKLGETVEINQEYVTQPWWEAFE